MHNLVPKHLMVACLPRLHLRHSCFFPSTPKFRHNTFIPFSKDPKHLQPQDLTPVVLSVWNVLPFSPISLHLVSSNSSFWSQLIYSFFRKTFLACPDEVKLLSYVNLYFSLITSITIRTHSLFMQLSKLSIAPKMLPHKQLQNSWTSRNNDILMDLQMNSMWQRVCVWCDVCVVCVWGMKGVCVCVCIGTKRQRAKARSSTCKHLKIQSSGSPSLLTWNLSVC